MIRSARRWALLALPIVLTGCAGAQAGTAAGTASARSGGIAQPSPGAAAVPAVAGVAAPPATATMVCGEDIRAKVQRALVLPTEPTTSSTWANGLYTCRYALPQGPMTLTVHVLASNASAGAELDADRACTPGAQPLAGLGERAWGTPAGTVVVLKDNQILTVDTTALPEVFGVNDQKRTDLAYEVASDVLGCWTGDQ